MMTQAVARGGGYHVSLTADHDLLLGRLIASFTPNNSTHVVKLPPATKYSVGHCVQVIVNCSATDTFALHDAEDNALATISSLGFFTLALMDNSTDAGDWIVREEQLLGRGAG